MKERLGLPHPSTTNGTKSSTQQNKAVRFKLDHSLCFEPIAASDDEIFMSNSGCPVTVEKSGLVINPDNYIFWSNS